jgi:putative DNA primase/helicase
MSTVLSAKHVARALGGDAIGFNQVSAPGPNHTARDRSLSIRLEPSAPSGFIVHSHAGDDPIACRDYVRSRLGLPSWRPGDEQDRGIDRHHVNAFDRAAVEQESAPRPRTDDDLIRINRARQIWGEAGDPRGTLVERYLRSRCLVLTDDLAGASCGFIHAARGGTRTRVK